MESCNESLIFLRDKVLFMNRYVREENMMVDFIKREIDNLNFDLLTIALKYIKYESQIKYSDQVYDVLLRSMSSIVNSELRCRFIETLVTFESFEFDLNIFEDYVDLINEGNSDFENIKLCLGAFLVSGLEKSTLLEHMSKSPYPDFAVELMASVGGDWETNNPALIEFVERINIKWRQNYRIGVITQLILVTHPAILSGDPFNGYKSVDAAIHDWAWFAADSTRNCLNRKIITVSESDQLIEIGQYIRSNPKIDTEKAKHLYDAFFGGRDPFDVMYDLPK